MYIKFNETTVKKIEELTSTDYTFKYNSIPADSIEELVEDLLNEIDRLESKINDLEQDIENNYQLKERNEYEECGLSINDFI